MAEALVSQQRRPTHEEIIASPRSTFVDVLNLLPFFVIMVGFVALLVAFPQMATLLPQLLF